MQSAKLLLQTDIGDAIVTQLAADAITAEVVTNPTQGGDYPFVVIGDDPTTGEDTNRSELRTSIAHNVTAHSDNMTEAKQVADSIIQAIGPGGTALTLDANFYEVRRDLEAEDITTEYKPEGDLYHALVRVRFLISHI